MMDKFFDLLNIKNDTEHTTSVKEFLTPFPSPNDKRFKWLINDFLSYFERWQESIEGNFTTADKKKMFLPHQTYTSILINVHSIIEMVLGMAQITIVVTMTKIIFVLLLILLMYVPDVYSCGKVLHWYAANGFL